MNSPLSSAYLRFLQLSRTLSSNDEKALSANERALLETIALAWFQKQPLTVRQAISNETLGSPATLHKRLATLRTMGFVEDQGVDADRRTKQLLPTAKTLAFFDKLGVAMSQPGA